MKKIIWIIAALISLAITNAWGSAVVTFTLDPANGALAGTAGTSAGWGFTISTDSDVIAIESFAFNEATPIGSFVQFVPGSLAQAGSPISASFVQGSSGLEYDISALAILGAKTQGAMTLTYDDCTDTTLGNCVFGDTVNAKFSGSDVTASVTVNAVPPVSNVPEPGMFVLTGVGLALLAGGARLRLRRPAVLGDRPT